MASLIPFVIHHWSPDGGALLPLWWLCNASRLPVTCNNNSWKTKCTFSSCNSVCNWNSINLPQWNKRRLPTTGGLRYTSPGLYENWYSSQPPSVKLLPSTITSGRPPTPVILKHSQQFINITQSFCHSCAFISGIFPRMTGQIKKD